MAKYNTLSALFTAIANSLRSKTGGSGKIVADDFPTVIDGLSTGGITPTGTKTITANGSHDVTTFATAQVNVPVGITPSGTKTITANGNYDVTNFAMAQVNVPVPAPPVGLNARIFTATVSSDVTSGDYTLSGANEFLASIRSNPKAFVWVTHMNHPASTAMYSMWLNANFNFVYTGTSARNTMIIRTTASANNVTFNYNGVAGPNYTGHMSVESDGSIKIRGCNTTYPVKAGEYRIIAGTADML